MNKSRICLLFATAFVVCAAPPMFATRPFVVDHELAVRLEKGIAPGETLELRDIALIDGNPATLTLERFEVWRPDAEIIVYEADGKSFHKLPRPDTKFYKGMVNGDRDSVVEISVGRNGRIAGMIMANDRIFTIGRGIPLHNGVRAARRDDDVTPIDRSDPLLIREFDDVEDLANNPQAANWHCDLDTFGMGRIRRPSANPAAGGAASDAAPAAAPTGTPATGVSYSLNLAVETDAELRAAFVSDAAELTYLQGLIAAASVIYQRDLNTTLTIGTVHQWTNAATDPWTVTTASTTGAALAELGAYWHNNYSGVARSSVVFMSGKLFSGGVAWIDTLCSGDFFCGSTGSSCGSSTYANSYAGGYAFCGSSGSVATTTPDPTLTINGTQFALPSANYWPLLEVTHELGHNANGPHTHCVAVTASQRTQYGVVDGRTFVDQCASGECYVGSTSAPAEYGTIMSYCHLIAASGFPGFRASRYRFYKIGEISELMLGDTAARCTDQGTSTCRLTQGLGDGTSGLNATITIGSNLACSAGKTASVPANASATFSWQITGGSITAGAATNQITFTPSAPSVTVTVTVSNASGCAIINSATASTQCGAISAPVNLVASASGTSVTVTWNTVSGATSYNVYRSTDNVNFTSFNTAGPPFVQTGLAADTAYIYKVRAFNGAESGDSNKDLAETTVFAATTAGTTKLSAADITALRTAVNAVRKLANGGVANNFGFTDATLTPGTTKVRGIHITELRSTLDAARSTLGLTALSYTDPVITNGSTKVRAVHVTDLRAGVQ